MLPLICNSIMLPLKLYIVLYYSMLPLKVYYAAIDIALMLTLTLYYEIIIYLIFLQYKIYINK